MNLELSLQAGPALHVPMALGGVDNLEQQQSEAQRAREGTSKGLARQELLSVEPWGVKSYIQSHLRARRYFPKSPSSFWEETCRHVASTSGSGPRGVSGCCSG